MSQLIKRSLLIFSLCVVPAVVSAQTCSSQSNSQHLIDNNDGTVSDTSTGLMWKKCIEGNSWDSTTNSCVIDLSTIRETFSWYEALVRVVEVNGGMTGQNFAKSDWRVPNIKELLSMADTNCRGPSINEVMFPSITRATGFSAKKNEFWSSTNAHPSRSRSAWSLILKYGPKIDIPHKNERGTIWVRLVRSINL